MRKFVAFYLDLVRDIPAVLRNTAEAYLFWAVSILLPVAVWFRPSLEPLMEASDFSRWFVLVPIAFSVVYGMLRVNFRKFVTLQERAQGFETALADIRQATPRLVLREPGAVHVEPAFFRTPVEHLRAPRGWTADFLRIRFMNDPSTTAPTAVARDVVAKVTFARDGQVLRIVDGRWSESDQPGERIVNAKSTTDLLRMNFGIGEERNLDLAFKAVEETDCFIFNNDNYNAMPSFRMEKHRLPPGAYDVEVWLRGVHVDERFNLRFVNKGAGHKIEFTVG